MRPHEYRRTRQNPISRCRLRSSLLSSASHWNTHVLDGVKHCKTILIPIYPSFIQLDPIWKVRKKRKKKTQKKVLFAQVVNLLRMPFHGVGEHLKRCQRITVPEISRLDFQMIKKNMVCLWFLDVFGSTHESKHWYVVKLQNMVVFGLKCQWSLEWQGLMPRPLHMISEIAWGHKMEQLIPNLFAGGCLLCWSRTTGCPLFFRTTARLWAFSECVLFSCTSSILSWQFVAPPIRWIQYNIV